MQFPSSKGLGLRPQSFELKRPKKPRLSRKLDELKMPKNQVGTKRTIRFNTVWITKL